jgi:HrpA-like RNA helicase
MSNNNVGILDPDGVNDNPLTKQPYSDTYKELAKGWSSLPAYQNAHQNIDQIRNNQVILVQSGTGSGKTVLFPKYVLHALNYNAKIAITLPKQMITKSAATYAALTLDVKLGDDVGYQYRGSGKNTNSDKTKLLYCTDGTLVARLTTDPKLNDFDAVLIDEAHERKVNIDLLLFLLRNVLRSRPEFKLIIMSATINEEIFRKYYKEFKYTSLAIGTKTNYPIKSVFLDENISSKEYINVGKQIITKLLTSKNKEQGGILFFVTSIRETEDMCDTLQKEGVLGSSNICVPVFSGMNEEKQKIATDKDYYRQFVSGNGVKVIVATNSAESSLTIDGVTDVIDCGLELKSKFDPVNRINILEKGFITNAQARQRMGRTGRTSPGTCYHLYTKKAFDHDMDRFPSPAIKVESISNEILRLIDMLPDVTTIGEVKKTLNDFIEPPDNTFVSAELNYLYNMNLITSVKNDGVLTIYGKLVSDMNIEPSDAIALATAYKLNCFREVLAIICVSEFIDGSIDKLFTLPMDILDDDISLSTDDKTNQKTKEGGRLKWLTDKFNIGKKHFNNRYGDHIAILKIFSEFEKKRKDQDKLKDWSYKYFIDKYILEKAYQQYVKLKHRYRSLLKQFNSSNTDRSALDTDIQYRVLASLIFGYNLNLLKVDTKGHIKSIDSTIDNIQLEKNCFIDRELKSTDKLFYNQLYRYDSNPIKAKIVSLISKKSLTIIDQLK